MAALIGRTRMWHAGPAPRSAVAGRPGALRLEFTLSRGMRVGLFGGSFNPAHPGHAHVAETALMRLGLHRVIWLVTPQNPLKSAEGLAPLAERLASARRQARGPWMLVSDAETRMGVRFTFDTLRILKARFPGVNFLWIMGGDSLAGFHRWRGWAEIMRRIPVVVVARPSALMRSRTAPTVQRFAHARRRAMSGRAAAAPTPPAWVYLEAPLNVSSSTALRQFGYSDRD